METTNYTRGTYNVVPPIVRTTYFSNERNKSFDLRPNVLSSHFPFHSYTTLLPMVYNSSTPWSSLTVGTAGFLAAQHLCMI